MTFLNMILLAGLVAVAIPIVIHLLNRRKARTVEWGAMRFLLATLARQSRRIFLEEVILMILRCLVVAMIVLAMARPFVPTRSSLPWALVLPAFLGAAMCAAVGFAMWSSRRARWWLLGASAVLLAGAVAVSLLERWNQESRWRVGGGQTDVAILIDGSTSMNVMVGGTSNFSRAIDEAKAVVGALHPGDAVSLLLAGPIPRPVIPTPTSSRREVLDALVGLSPPGGPMQTLEAFNAAVTALLEGHNPAKKIILITDGQNIGWDVGSPGRWQFLAQSLRQFPVPPQVICRTISLPKSFNNLAVADISLSRAIVGTDRPVTIDVKVHNAGSIPAPSRIVELSVDGKSVARQPLGEIQPSAAQSARFEHQFKAVGHHVIAATVHGDDDLPADNTAVRVIDVLQTLPVLIVDGDPSPQPLGGAASFVELALAPRASEAGHASEIGSASQRFLVEPKVVPFTEVASIRDWNAYRAVVLADVPRLPWTAARSLAEFVRGGGGLLVAPGGTCKEDFYNGWNCISGEPVMPARIRQRIALPQTPARVAVKSFNHPALALLAEDPKSDIAEALVHSYWKLDEDKDPSATLCASLQMPARPRPEGGDEPGGTSPLMVQRTLGHGRVIALATALDARDGNLPALWSYVPLVHEMVYYLAAPTFSQMNVRPGSPVMIDLPGDVLGRAKVNPADPAVAAGVEVLTPSGARRSAPATCLEGKLRLHFAQADQPGLYQFLVHAAGERPSGKEVLRQPFAVMADPAESRLVELTESDFAQAGKQVPIVRAATLGELLACVGAGMPGDELSNYLILAALAAMVLEIVLTRWIAIRRKSHLVEAIDFGERLLDVDAFRAQGRQIQEQPARSQV